MYAFKLQILAYIFQKNFLQAKHEREKKENRCTHYYNLVCKKIKRNERVRSSKQSEEVGESETVFERQIRE